MDTIKHEHYFNESFMWHQKSVLDSQHKVSNPLLTPIECVNNYLCYLDDSFPLGIFKLSDLPTQIYNAPTTAKEYYELVKFIAYIENLLNDYPNYINELKDLIEKIVLSDLERSAIDDFVNNYNFMSKNKETLYGNTSLIWKEYNDIVENIKVFAKQNRFLTEGQLIINENIIKKDDNLNNSENGRGNTMVRTLKNPDIPNMVSDDEQFFSKAGFVSIILILYSIINAAIIVAINLLK